IPAGGSYRFQYQFAAAAPRPCTIGSTEPGEGKSSVLSRESCRTELGLTDLYAISLPENGTLDLTLTSNASLAGILAVRDLKDNLLLLTEDAQALGGARLPIDLPAGMYTIAVGARSG